jgi:hypothetical protein
LRPVLESHVTISHVFSGWCNLFHDFFAVVILYD